MVREVLLHILIKDGLVKIEYIMPASWQGNELTLMSGVHTWSDTTLIKALNVPLKEYLKRKC